ncbi:MAG: hypothetical protein NZ532_02410 [Thermoflexales bacterium]|nr:hypothetical protein [Thermoflexales bacterium]
MEGILLMLIGVLLHLRHRKLSKVWKRMLAAAHYRPLTGDRAYIVMDDPPQIVGRRLQRLADYLRDVTGKEWNVVGEREPRTWID